MLPAVKAEFRKLVSVRSTYIIIGISVVLALFFAGYTEGFKADKATLLNPNLLTTEVTNALTACAFFCSLIAIFLFSHEYRYNTIMHTLTSINSRSKVLIAKMLVMTGFAAVYALFIGVLSPLFAYMGIQLAGHDLVHQVIPYSDLLWRGLFFFWGYAMAGLLFVALTRNQVFSVVAMLFIPSTIEAIISGLLKHNAVYMPFTALMNVINNGHDITHQKAAYVFLAWLISSWIIVWILFLRRDATNNNS